MISFRYHVVSLVAVLLALAAGIALGGGPLSELGRSDQPAPARADASEEPSGSATGAFADALAAQGAERMYDGGLEDSSVLLISFPGVSEAERAAISGQIEAAGGTVASSLAVQPALVDPGEKTLVDTLGSQLMTQLPDATVSADATTYPRVGELLGVALTTTDDTGRKPLGEQATGILAGLDGADLVTETAEPAGRASYVVALVDSGARAETDPIYAGLVSGLTAHAAGVVVAADQADGLLSRLRENPLAAQIATVDGLAGSAGQVTTVLALTEWPSTKGGAFGASGADGAVGLR